MWLVSPCITCGLLYLLTFSRTRITLPFLISTLIIGPSFWFLKSCFICHSLAWFAKKIPIGEWGGVFVMLILCQYLNIFFIPFMFCNFTAGMILRKFSIIKYWGSNNWLVITLFFIFLYILKEYLAYHLDNFPRDYVYAYNIVVSDIDIINKIYKVLLAPVVLLPQLALLFIFLKGTK